MTVEHIGWDTDKAPTGRTHKGNPVKGISIQKGLNKWSKQKGLFIPCNMGLIEQPIGDRNLYRVKDGRYGKLSFANLSNLNKHEVTLQYESGTGIRLRYEGANCSLESISDNKPKFKAQQGVTIEHIPTYKGVKITMLLDDPLNAPDSFKFSIEELGAGFTSCKEFNGGLLFDGPEPIIIHAPYAEDANGEIGKVVLEKGPIEGGHQTFIKRIVDISWLRQAVVPVRVDPFITIEDGVDGGIIYETHIRQDNPNTNFGSFTATTVHEFTPAAPVHMLLYASLASVGDVNWLSGKFIMTYQSSAGSLPYNAKVFRLKKAWTEGTVTWNTADAAWETPGALGTTDKATLEESTSSLDASATDDFVISPDTLNNYWNNDIDNKGAIAIAQATGSFVVYWTSEHTSNHPIFYGEFAEAGIVRGLGRGLNKGLGKGLG